MTKKAIRQNISDIFTEEGRQDIIKRFKDEEYPPILTFLQEGEHRRYKVVSVTKGIWVVPVTLYKPEELDVVDV